MSRSSTLVLLGIITILAPLSGFPSAFRSLVILVCGALVLSIGLAMRRATAVPAPVGVPLATTAEDVPEATPSPHHTHEKAPHAPAEMSAI